MRARGEKYKLPRGKRRAEINYLLAAIVGFIFGGMVLATVPSIVGQLWKATDVCGKSLKTKPAEIKDKLLEVCSNPLAEGAFREFSATEPSCEEETRFYAATCDKIGLWLSTGSYFRRMEFVPLYITPGMLPYGSGYGIYWSIMMLDTADASSKKAPPADIEAQIAKIYSEARSIDDPDSVFSQVGKITGGDLSKIPSEDLGRFISNNLQAVLNAEETVLVPWGLDSTLVISGVGIEEITPEIAAGSTEAKALARDWQGAFKDKLISAYSVINQPVLAETEISRNIGKISEVFVSTPDNGITLRQGKTDILSRAYSDIVQREGGDLSGSAGQFREVPGNPSGWEKYVNRVYDFNNKNILYRDPPKFTQCKAPGNFCKISELFSEKLANTQINLDAMSERYSRIVSARSSALSLIEGKILSGECETYSGTGYRIPTCAVVVSCSKTDSEFYREISVDACVISAVNLLGNPSLYPIASVERKDALESWDITLSDRHIFTGTCSSSVPIECPYFDSLTNSESAKRTVLLCLRNFGKDCENDGNCFCCETVSCENEVEFHTKTFGKTVVTNVEGLAPAGGKRIVTHVNGSVYPFCIQEDQNVLEMASCVWNNNNNNNNNKKRNE